MKIPTTVIGSYPPISENVTESRAVAIDDQMDAGIDIISDGQVRADMRKLFLMDMEGIEVRDGRYQVVDKVYRDRSIAVEDLKDGVAYLGNSRRFKGILTGPLTLCYGIDLHKGAPYKSSLPYPDQSLLDDVKAAQMKVAKRYDRMDLSYIQIDEPTLGMVGPWDPALEALEELFQSIDTPTVLHVCGKLRTDLFEKLLDISGLDLLALEFSASPDNLNLLASELFINSDKKLAFGCVNSKSAEIESPTEILDLIHKAPMNKLGLINPDCGLRNLERETCLQKLKNLSIAGEKL